MKTHQNTIKERKFTGNGSKFEYMFAQIDVICDQLNNHLEDWPKGTEKEFSDYVEKEAKKLCTKLRSDSLQEENGK